MDRKIVSRDAIAGLVRAQMAMLPTCGGCVCGPVRWRKPDGDGCHWILSRLEGPRCLECLEQLLPVLDSLRHGFNVSEPAMHVVELAIDQRVRIRVPVAPASPEDRARWVAHDRLLDTARAAVRASSTTLRTHRMSRKATRRQLSGAAQAVESSRALLHALASHAAGPSPAGSAMRSTTP